MKQKARSWLHGGECRWIDQRLVTSRLAFVATKIDYRLIHQPSSRRRERERGSASACARDWPDFSCLRAKVELIISALVCPCVKGTYGVSDKAIMSARYRAPYHGLRERGSNDRTHYQSVAVALSLHLLHWHSASTDGLFQQSGGGLIAIFGIDMIRSHDTIAA